MFLGQVMSVDGSCQDIVDQAAVEKLLVGIIPRRVNTNDYCQARQRLPLPMIRNLARRNRALLRAQLPRP